MHTSVLCRLSKCEKKRVGSSTIKKSIFLYTYDIIISALILAFVYWIAINGVESSDVLFIIFLTLFVLVMIKCLFDNKELRIRPIIGIIINDLIKPVMSMLTGLFLCIICLGDSWKGAKNYASDTANTVILIVSITGLVSMIVIASYLVLGVIKLLKFLKRSKTFS